MTNTKPNKNSVKRTAVISNGWSAVATRFRDVGTGIVRAAVTAYDRAEPRTRATIDSSTAAYRRNESRARALVIDLYGRTRVHLDALLDTATPMVRRTSTRVRVAFGFGLSAVLIIAVTFATFRAPGANEEGSTNQESHFAFTLPDGPDGEQNTAAALEMLWRDAGMADSSAGYASGSGLFSQAQEPSQSADQKLATDRALTGGTSPVRQFYTASEDSSADNPGERIVNAMNSLAQAASGMGAPSLAPAPTPGVSVVVLAAPTATPSPVVSLAPPARPTATPAQLPTSTPAINVPLSTATPVHQVVISPEDEPRFVPTPESKKARKDREKKNNKKVKPTSTPSPVAVPTLAPLRVSTPVPTSTPKPITTPVPATIAAPIASTAPTATPEATATTQPILIAEPITSTEAILAPEPTATAEPVKTAPEPTATAEPVKTATPEPTATAEPTKTATPEPTATAEPTKTATPEPTPTSSSTLTADDIFAMYEKGLITYMEMLQLLSEL